MLGIDIHAKAFHDILPLLKKDGVEVVVLRVSGGGGVRWECEKFIEVLERDYKPAFRTVVWVESATAATAEAVLPVEEMYFTPTAVFWVCNEFIGCLCQSGWERDRLPERLARVERACRLGKRSPAIGRAMMNQEPLSYTIGADGAIEWFPSTSGKTVLQRDGEGVCVLNADTALACRFSKGTAATREELARAMGLMRVEWVGADASKFLDDELTYSEALASRLDGRLALYGLSLQAARDLKGEPDRARRIDEVKAARGHLDEIENLGSLSANILLIRNIDREWLAQQREILKQLDR